MNLKFHNPDKLTPDMVGKGYRLLLVTETRQDATHWFGGEEIGWRTMCDKDGTFEIFDSVTYRTDKPLPVPTPAPEITEFGPKFKVEDPVVIPLDGGKGGYMVYEGDKMMYVPAPPDTQDKADAVLNERAQSYGKFIDNARIARSLKAVVAGALLDRQDTIPDDMAEALDVILSKIARIVSGTEKGWHDQLLDIEGYARLVRERIEGNPR